MGRKLMLICVTLLLIFTCCDTAFAEGFDRYKRGSLSVTLTEQKQNEPIVGAELSVYYIATVTINWEGDLIYEYTKDFKKMNVAMEDTELMAKMDAYISHHNIPYAKIVTDAEGTAVCNDLPLGLYFVKQTGTVEGFAPCAPFLVTVPSKNGDGYVYDVNASPKTEVERLTTVTIKKVWNTDASMKATDHVTVQLLKNGNVVKTATLNEQNGWQMRYTDMPESDAYSIKEVNIPKGFTATYKQNGDTFTVTNTSTLIQTGQLIWPIPVLAVCGMLLLVAGVVLLKQKTGVICILLGTICILGAVGCIVYNHWESRNAAKVTESLLEDIQSVIDEEKTEQDNVQTEMPTVKVDGYECIGILSVPVLKLELPVLTDWSYEKLKKAPCHYYGSYYEEDFVIAAHNYKVHFGRLSELQVGDAVTFTNVNGVVYRYEVELLETLPKDATKEMITSGFALSLYTCTPGGGNRVTVRCKSMQ